MPFSVSQCKAADETFQEGKPCFFRHPEHSWLLGVVERELSESKYEVRTTEDRYADVGRSAVPPFRVRGPSVSREAGTLPLAPPQGPLTPAPQHLGGAPCAVRKVGCFPPPVATGPGVLNSAAPMLF